MGNPLAACLMVLWLLSRDVIPKLLVDRTFTNALLNRIQSKLRGDRLRYARLYFLFLSASLDDIPA